MIRSRFFVLVASSACLVGGAALHALQEDEFRSRGSGTFSVDCEDTPIVHADLELGRGDGDNFLCTLELKGGTTLELRGDCDGHGHHRFFTVKQGLGKSELKGAGEFTISDNEAKLRSLVAYGIVDGKSFLAKFKAAMNRDRGKDDGHSFSDNVAGNGRLDLGNRKARVTHLRVRMSRNGDLEVHAEGPEMRDTTWQGRWRGDGPEYEVDLRHHGSLQVRARGTILLSKNHRTFKRLEVEGKEGGEFFRLFFEFED
jgi:hypothetical protein